MKNKITYIAGPYRAGTVNGIYNNIQDARKCAQFLASMGRMYFCPHLNSQFMDGLCPDKFWLEMAMEQLRRCDDMVIFGDWPKSSGTRAEIFEAKDMGYRIETVELLHQRQPQIHEWSDLDQLIFDGAQKETKCK